MPTLASDIQANRTMIAFQGISDCGNRLPASSLLFPESHLNHMLNVTAPTCAIL
ncbi:hypothetical protein Pmar_PMAR001678 [Perkinsus marinus ATCC 50983]|uniref:Uncharacterized protein n=1 Tax=Perkinsus marinus (strain ATCC 50983 / TXsc) TaxID=423536 RepID=C5LM30_PERM5|nr:hypothetical protein Pmar_PMAR001678 [Perkinsus marinus ATCC 50983]EER02215.1 hypothetical protein Pmar_PMAR001678 [Perkinsus marinus ATCC 50983]|eukprot:XP_002769497.1 hypothetical protein Pmar_PMAR001678 [Perkinsus marinus ATCC 50983]